MLITGVLNPALNSLLSRVRHTNTLVIADRGFPFWPQIETVDLSLMDGVPTVLQALAAIRTNFKIGQAFMAKEFIAENTRRTRNQFLRALTGIPVAFEPHVEFKQRVPQAIGLVRTGDPVQYANLILVSA
jgi:D-ribose pyranase